MPSAAGDERRVTVQPLEAPRDAYPGAVRGLASFLAAAGHYVLSRPTAMLNGDQAAGHVSGDYLLVEGGLFQPG